VVRARSRFCSHIASIAPRRLIFLDEFGVDLAMTPTRARAPRGDRAVGYAPLRGTRINFVFALGLRGVLAPLVYRGTTTAPMVQGYLRKCLVRALRSGEVLVMDNHPAHDRTAVGTQVRRVGAGLWFLPPYSPDLSPIEHCGSKLKESIRRAEPRTLDAVITAIRRALTSVTPEDIQGWFEHCGYHARSF
jgi:transposase